jgi:2-polyprenyl-3-methyl-5-hydroxy-6-metoxy-1,4-benzoquinol methylase
MKSKKCLVCDNNAKTLSLEVDNGYKINRCNTCHFTWVDRDSIAQVDKEPVYDDYQYNYNLEEQFKLMEEVYKAGFLDRIKRIKKENGEKKPVDEISFLDVGCANGEYLKTAQSIGIKKIYGVEIDKKAKKNASQYGTVVDDPNAFDTVLFDVIQIKNVLSNIEDMNNFFQTYCKLLKPDGVMWLDVLNQDALLSVLRNILKPNYQQTGRYGPLRPPYVINGFTKNAVKKYAEKYGLEVSLLKTSYLGSQYVPYTPPGKIAQIIRVGSSYIGAGSMIISELRKTG